jgi:hypothetical protein
MVVALLGAAASVEGQTLSNRPDGMAEWSVDFLIYWWGASFDGDASVGTADGGSLSGDFANASATDISGTGLLQIRHASQWGFLLEGAEVEGDQDINTAAGPGSLNLEFGWLTMAGTYTIDSPVLVEPFAGVRLFTAEGIQTTGNTIIGDEAKSWADPLVGVKLAWQPSERLGLGLMADIGGFGANTELTWDVVPTVRYHVNELFSVLGGYRYSYVDYDKSKLKFDLAMQGPFAGLGVRF